MGGGNLLRGIEIVVPEPALGGDRRPRALAQFQRAAVLGEADLVSERER